MDQLQENLLYEIAGIRHAPKGAYNIRLDGDSVGRQSSENITVSPMKNKQGLEIHIKPETKDETIHIPVVISQSGLKETVYNDFYIGENADVKIIAGCGIHNCSNEHSQHDGIHTFYVGKNARVVYVEKHYGSGDETSKRIFNPVTKVYLDTDAYMEIETTQIKGVSDTRRETQGKVLDGASLIVKEKLLTTGDEFAETKFDVELDGVNSSTNVISRSVAKDKSTQIFLSKINGNNKCYGHSECDAIIMDKSVVKAIPEITANHIDASLVHEAAIGKIAGEQLVKLMTLGLSEEEAEEQIVNGFLK